MKRTQNLPNTLDIFAIFAKMGKKKLNIDLNNPDALSLMQRLFRLIFGQKRPDLVTRSFFFSHLVGASLFWFWYISAYFSIHFLENIRGAYHLKRMLTKRGVELGIKDFREVYETFAFLMIIVWLIYIIGLILMWRGQRIYRYFLFGVLAAYPLMILVFLNFNYLRRDVTLFDKVLYLILLVSILVYYWIDKRKANQFTDETIDNTVEEESTSTDIQENH
jgi:hypothetical protein